MALMFLHLFMNCINMLLHLTYSWICILTGFKITFEKGTMFIWNMFFHYFFFREIYTTNQTFVTFNSLFRHYFNMTNFFLGYFMNTSDVILHFFFIFKNCTTYGTFVNISILFNKVDETGFTFNYSFRVISVVEFSRKGYKIR